MKRPYAEYRKLLLWPNASERIRARCTRGIAVEVAINRNPNLLMEREAELKRRGFRPHGPVQTVNGSLRGRWWYKPLQPSRRPIKPAANE